MHVSRAIVAVCAVVACTPPRVPPRVVEQTRAHATRGMSVCWRTSFHRDNALENLRRNVSIALEDAEYSQS